MNLSQEIALNDAFERLTYALLSEDDKEIAEAQKELDRAKEMNSGKPSPQVIARLVENNPEAARNSGLIE